MHRYICKLDNSFKLYIQIRTTIKLIYVNSNSDYSVFGVKVYLYTYIIYGGVKELERFVDTVEDLSLYALLINYIILLFR